MGSKNRIYLGILTKFILHFHRNIFKKNIYMSKRIQDKINLKHPNIKDFTQYDNFQILLNNTIGSCPYDKYNNVINFIVHIEDENKYIIYSLKSEKHNIICNTIFSLRPDTLKKYYQDTNFKLFKNEYKEIIEEYIN